MGVGRQMAYPKSLPGTKKRPQALAWGHSPDGCSGGKGGSRPAYVFNVRGVSRFRKKYDFFYFFICCICKELALRPDFFAGN
jgi:hypothetical protein